MCAWSVEITSKEKVAMTFEIPKCLQKLGGDLLGFSLRWRCKTSSLEYESVEMYRCMRKSVLGGSIMQQYIGEGFSKFTSNLPTKLFNW